MVAVLVFLFELEGFDLSQVILFVFFLVFLTLTLFVLKCACEI